MWRVIDTATVTGREAWTVSDGTETSVHKFLTCKEAGQYAEVLNRHEYRGRERDEHGNDK